LKGETAEESEVGAPDENGVFASIRAINHLTHIQNETDDCPTARRVPPWEANPYGLVSWWDMEVFSASEFYRIARALERLGDESASILPLKTRMRNVDVQESLKKLGLTLSLAQTRRIQSHWDAVSKSEDKAVAPATTKFAAEVQELIRGLQERIEDEMGERLFLYIPPDEAELYSSSDAFFSPTVIAKWSNLLEDVSEAVKCLSLSRYTASVFHLMRIMEFSVQKLGDKLGVDLAEEKNWQVILDQVNKAIKNLDQKVEKTKTLALVSANLYNVKLAWRNEVMHPKATYTKEESKRVLDSVKSFVEELVNVV
jgi:hypothetical protein